MSTFERMLIFLGLAAISAICFIALSIQIDGLNTEQATIGGTTVPAIHCAEDEVISWLAPDTLGCVHYEEVN